MERPILQFNINERGKSLAALIRARAIKAGSHIVYMENDQLIEENPRTGEKIVIKANASKGG